jgi:hypothetical protein
LLRIHAVDYDRSVISPTARIAPFQERAPRGTTSENKRLESVKKATDSIQARLSSYACNLNYDALSPEAISTAKARVIDTLDVLICGFFAEPCRIARNLAAQI